MFIDLAQSFLMRPDIPNDTVETLIIMILIPLFWVLRGSAIIGISYPIIKVLFVSPKKKHFLWDLSFSIFWTIFNILILISNMNLYWKWVWIDLVGTFIVITSLFSWNGSIIRRQVLHSFKMNKNKPSEKYSRDYNNK